MRAYGPGEVQILVSSDGGNFEEASCWRAATRSEVAYRETIMFGREQKVKAVSIVMKSPMPWGYFGLNDVSLLTSGEESFMIVSGERSDGAEQCLTVVGSEIVIDSCLDALAATVARFFDFTTNAWCTWLVDYAWQPRGIIAFKRSCRIAPAVRLRMRSAQSGK